MNLSLPCRLAAGVLVACLVVVTGCKPKPEANAPLPPKEPTSAKPSAVVSPPPGTPPPVAEPTPARVLYVATAFQAVSEVGTHDFPVGTPVNLVAEEGDEYLVEYNGVSVRNQRSYFSETPILPAGSSEPAASPVASPETTPSPTPAPSVAADSTPDPALAADEQKTSELIGEIRDLNKEIRTTEEKIQREGASPQAADSAEVEKLKKRRDQLSEDLTKVAKP